MFLYLFVWYISRWPLNFALSWQIWIRNLPAYLVMSYLGLMPWIRLPIWVEMVEDQKKLLWYQLVESLSRNEHSMDKLYRGHWRYNWVPTAYYFIYQRLRTTINLQMNLLSETQIRCLTKSQQHLTHLSYILQNIIFVGYVFQKCSTYRNLTANKCFYWNHLCCLCNMFQYSHTVKNISYAYNATV